MFRVELEFRIPEGQADRQFWAQMGISRMFVMDTDEETCGNIKTLMGDVGVEADLAHNMEEALSLLEKNAGGYQVALLGGSIVETGAAQAVNQIRERIGETVPVLVLSDHGKAEAVDLDQTENADVLIKPFFASAFKEKILEMRAEPKRDGESAAEPGQSLAGLHFLAAEDNEINAEILREILAYENRAVR